jgi:hypothetical protein
VTWLWKKKEWVGLARYVDPEAERWLRLPVSRLHPAGQPDGVRDVVEALYTELVNKQIRYAPELYRPNDQEQAIRKPREVLREPGKGTCLDLAALFCGLCLGSELLPILIVTQKHALAAVSVNHAAREYSDFSREEYARLFEHRPLEDSAALIDLVNRGAYVAIECTGFAHTDELPETTPEGLGRVEGVLPFEQALAAGRKQLDRDDSPMVFALDIATAQYGWNMAPAKLSGYDEIAIEETVVNAFHTSGALADVRAAAEARYEKLPPPNLEGLMPFGDLLDRQDELAATARSLSRDTPVRLVGTRGSGKTALLRRTAHGKEIPRYPDGKVYVSGGASGGDDLILEVFDAFYDTDRPHVLTQARARRMLHAKKALVVVDDTGLDESGLTLLRSVLPQAGFLLASEVEDEWGSENVLALRGLPIDEAVALLSAELGGDLSNRDQSAAQRMCESLDGHPGYIVQLAAAIEEEDLCAHRFEESLHGETLQPFHLSKRRHRSLKADESEVVSVLATLSPDPVPVEHLRVLVGHAAERAIRQLLDRGVVESHSPSYSLAGPLANDLPPLVDAVWTDRTIDHFTTWAEEFQRDPDRIATSSDVAIRAMDLAADAGRWQSVYRLGRAIEPTLALSGRWDRWGAALESVSRAAGTIGDVAGEAWALHQLGTRALALGDAETAKAHLEKSLRMQEELGDVKAADTSRHNLGLSAAKPKVSRWKMWKLWLGLAVVAIVTAVVVPFLINGEVPEVEPPGATTEPPAATAPAQARLVSENAIITFPETTVGGVSGPLFADFSNNGDVPLSFEGAVVEGPDRTDYAIDTGDCTLGIDPGDSCRIIVTFSPQRPGVRRAELVADFGLAGSSVVLVGEGIGTSSLLVDPEVLDFERVPVSEAVERTVVVYADGDAAVRILSVELVGRFLDAFAVVSDACGGRELEAHAVCEVVIAFRPGNNVFYEARLVVTPTVGESIGVEVFGEGVAPLFEWDVGQEDNFTVIFVANSGEADLEISDVVVEGDDFFVADSTCDGPIPPDNACKIFIGFNGEGEGTFEAVVHIFSNSPTSPDAIPIERFVLL